MDVVLLVWSRAALSPQFFAPLFLNFLDLPLEPFLKGARAIKMNCDGLALLNLNWNSNVFVFFPRNFSSVYWTSYWHYTYGNCFVFNGGKDKIGQRAPVLKSNKPGPSHGKTAV